VLPAAAMASTFLEADDEPAVLSVARLASELENSPALLTEATGLVEKGDVPALLTRLAASALLTAAPEKDAEAAFLVLAHAAGKLAAEPAHKAVSQILERVADAAADAPALRLRVLFALFNAVPHPRCRHAVLLRTLQFATATGQAEAVAHVVHRADAWAAEWAISAAELRALRRAVYDLLNKSKPAGKEAFAALVAYLALYEVRPWRTRGRAVPSYCYGARARAGLITTSLRTLRPCPVRQGEAAPVLAEVRDAAASAATHFIAAPDVFQCDLLDMAAVRRAAFPDATLTLNSAPRAPHCRQRSPTPPRLRVLGIDGFQTAGGRREVREGAPPADHLPDGCARAPTTCARASVVPHGRRRTRA
jgi:translation initiation factor 3 subunit M